MSAQIFDDNPAYNRVSPEVVYATTRVASAGPREIEGLKCMAAASPKARARLCAHPSSAAPQQEMLIVMRGTSYVAPHRHFDRSETLTVLEGAADALIFTTDGAVESQMAMTPFGAGGRFFYRMPVKTFHTLRFGSPWFVFLETTTGPFDRAASEAAPWAPSEDEAEAGRAFLAALS